MPPLCALLALLAPVTSHATLVPRESAPITRIAFGSCFRTTQTDQVWSTIQAWRPELVLLIGDNVYADTRDPLVMAERYAELAGLASFESLRSQCMLMATWDDHDYGENDAGREYPMRARSQELFLDFFGEPIDSERRRTPGVHASHLFGPEGRRLQVILLDTRSFRDPLQSVASSPAAYGYAGPYGPCNDPQRTMLGEEQWSWLERELRVPADLRLVASSIQVVARDHGYEKWHNLPHERARLVELIRSTEASGVVFLSGDRHHAELSVLRPSETARPDDMPLRAPYPLYDLTSSSLNAPSQWRNEVNRYRHGAKYHGPNFATIELDWARSRLSMAIRRSEDGRVLLAHEVLLGDLTPGEAEESDSRR